MRIQSLLKPSLAGLAAVILGLVYRYFDLDFGLPFAYRFDEMPMVEGSLRMAADKTLRPALAEYPSLYPYVLQVLYGVAYLVGKIAGFVRSPAEFGLRYFLDPSPFFLIARGINTLFGCLTIFLVYRIGARLFGAWAGVAGAFLLALSPLHQLQSVLALPNAPMAFAGMLAYLSILSILDGGARRDYLLAGVMIGLSVSFKYNSGLLVLPLFLAHFYARGRSSPRLLVESLIVIPVVFVICNPYWILEFGRFLEAFRFQASHMRLGHPGHYLGPPYLWFIPEMVRQEGIVGLALLGGLALSLVRWRRGDCLLLAYVIPSLLLILPLGNQGLDYTIALFPPLALLGGRAVFALIQFAGRRAGIVAGCAVALVIGAVAIGEAAGRLGESALPDTRTLARNWVEENLPAATKIGFDRFHYNPQFSRVGKIAGRPEADRYFSSEELARHEKPLNRATTYEMVSFRYTMPEIRWPEEAPREVVEKYGDEPYLQVMFRTGFYSVRELKDLGIEYFFISTHATRGWQDARWYPDDHPVHYMTLRNQKAYDALESGEIDLYEEWTPRKGISQGPGLKLYKIR